MRPSAGAYDEQGCENVTTNSLWCPNVTSPLCSPLSSSGSAPVQPLPRLPFLCTSFHPLAFLSFLWSVSLQMLPVWFRTSSRFVEDALQNYSSIVWRKPASDSMLDSCINSNIKLVKLWGRRALMWWVEPEGKGWKLAVRQRRFSLTEAAEAPNSEKQARLDVKWKADLMDWPELASRGRERGGFRVHRQSSYSCYSTSLGALSSSELWKGRGHVDVFSPLLLHRRFINEINNDWLETAGRVPSMDLVHLPGGASVRAAGTCASAVFQAGTVRAALRAFLHQRVLNWLMSHWWAWWERGDSTVSGIDRGIDGADSSLRERVYWHLTYWALWWIRLVSRCFFIRGQSTGQTLGEIMEAKASSHMPGTWFFCCCCFQKHWSNSCYRLN